LASITIDNDLLLRSYQVDEFGELFDAINTSRRHLAPWLNWVSKTTKPEHSLQFIQRSQDQLHNQEALPLGLFYKGRLAGGIGMHEWTHETKRAQIGYWISKEYEGKGLIVKSLITFVDYLFNKTGLNKIEIHYVPANTRSARVAERLGFRIEGIIRQSCSRNGVIEDIIITGLLKSEWDMATLKERNS
jgi:ribosomal-protein-serine acetyltransferase